MCSRKRGVQFATARSLACATSRPAVELFPPPACPVRPKEPCQPARTTHSATAAATASHPSYPGSDYRANSRNGRLPPGRRLHGEAERLPDPRVNDFRVPRDERLAHDLVRDVDLQLTPGHDQGQESRHVLAVHLAR